MKRLLLAVVVIGAVLLAALASYSEAAIERNIGACEIEAKLAYPHTSIPIDQVLLDKRHGTRHLDGATAVAARPLGQASARRVMRVVNVIFLVRCLGCSNPLHRPPNASVCARRGNLSRVSLRRARCCHPQTARGRKPRSAAMTNTPIIGQTTRKRLSAT